MELEHLKNVIESLLFISSKPVKVKDLANFLEQPQELIKAALDQLVEQRRHGGIVVLDNNGEYQLATNAAHSTQVKNFLNAELREKLTDATVEVLAIIAYRQPISKAEIEAIRGVNSQYSLRNLLMRGLVEKIPNPHDARGFLYQTTTDFLQHLGLVSTKDLPEFEKLVSQIKLPETPQLSQEAKAEEVSQQPESGPQTEAVIAADPAVAEPQAEMVAVAETAAAEMPAQEASVEPGLSPEVKPEEPKDEEFEEEDEFEDDEEDDEE